MGERVWDGRIVARTLRRVREPPEVALDLGELLAGDAKPPGAAPGGELRPAVRVDDEPVRAPRDASSARVIQRAGQALGAVIGAAAGERGEADEKSSGERRHASTTAEP